MMTIRQYFNALYAAANLDDFDEITDYERMVYEMTEEEREAWAIDHNIALDAYDEDIDEYVTTLWIWDMCGD